MTFPRDVERYKAPIFNHAAVTDVGTIDPGTSIHIFGSGKRRIELLVKYKNADTTIVMFHGAMPWKRIVLPIFTGMTVTDPINANLISVSDPSLTRNVNLSWYAGDDELPLQTLLPDVLQVLFTAMPEHRRVITYGGSGGGFASLFYASRLESSLAVAANPQTDIALYIQSVVDRYAKRAWGTESVKDAEIVSDLSSIYTQVTQNRVIYLQALGDSHVDKHLVPFLSQVPDRSHVGVRLLRNGLGHVPPSKPTITRVFECVVANGSDWHSIVSELDLDIETEPSQISELHRAYVDSLQLAN